jgi:hypothetical protein
MTASSGSRVSRPRPPPATGPALSPKAKSPHPACAQVGRSLVPSGTRDPTPPGLPLASAHRTSYSDPLLRRPGSSPRTPFHPDCGARSSPRPRGRTTPLGHRAQVGTAGTRSWERSILSRSQVLTTRTQKVASPWLQQSAGLYFRCSAPQRRRLNPITNGTRLPVERRTRWRRRVKCARGRGSRVAHDPRLTTYMPPPARAAAPAPAHCG